MANLIIEERHRFHADPLIAGSEKSPDARANASIAAIELVQGPSRACNTRLSELSIWGCYFPVREPFSKGSSVLVKIRTQTEIFECHAIVDHSTVGRGVGISFREVSPQSLRVLEKWLFFGVREESDESIAMDVKSNASSFHAVCSVPMRDGR